MRTKGSRPNRPKTFICNRCSKEFIGPNCFTKYCPPCRPIQQKEQEVEYIKVHSEIAKERVRRHRLNPEYRQKQVEWNKKWAAKNLEKVRDNKRVAQNNRVKKIRGVFTLEEWREMKDFYQNTCLSCKRSEPEIKLTIDHVNPFSKGGLNVKDNIQPLCLSCNCKKQVSVTDYRFLYD